LLSSNFKNWRLPIDGMVSRPTSFSVDDLKRLPARSQITHQACEEGWSFIAEWRGVRLSDVLAAVGVNAKARFVVVYAYDGAWDSLDLPDAYHPQTFLAYGLNGQEISAPHGAPLRLRVARQLGYKSVKFLSRITLVDSLKNVGDGRGSISPAYGYSWYAGI
jgi:DMSO/TMAO reductase YedYZ molybdopterin-dependent catalytic subunit